MARPFSCIDVPGGQLLAGQRGWGTGDEWADLDKLWTRESNWDPNAVNPSSGAYGIPQALGHGHPYDLGDSRAQILWGLDYIAGRYGDPIGAWNHSQSTGWYETGGILPAHWAGVMDQGGVVPPGAFVGVNNTGGNENLRPAGGDGLTADALVEAFGRAKFQVVVEGQVLGELTSQALYARSLALQG